MEGCSSAAAGKDRLPDHQHHQHQQPPHVADIRHYTRRFITEFIELYRSFPCLWKVRSYEYTNKALRTAAYDHMVQKLAEVEEHASRDMVVRKINTLRSSFRREHKKVRASLLRSSANSANSANSAASPYVPQLWYYNLLLFTAEQDTAFDIVMTTYKKDGDAMAASMAEDFAHVKAELQVPDMMMEEEAFQRSPLAKTGKKAVSGGRGGKKHRRVLSIEQKKEIIARHEGGVKVMELAQMYDTSHSTISTILAMRDRLMVTRVAKGTSRLNVRSPLFEEMESLLLAWIKGREVAGEATSQAAICHKARDLFQEVRQKTPSSSSEADEEDFKGSRGWFDNFKKRTGIHRVVKEACEEDEPFHHWKRPQPNRTFVTQEEDLEERDLLTDLVTTAHDFDEEETEEPPVVRPEPRTRQDHISTADIKKVLSMWDQVRSAAVQWTDDTAEAARAADLFDRTSMQALRAVLKERQKRQPTIDMFFAGPSVKKQTSKD